ncbi:6-phosphogluconolactonase [Desulfovibrio sp. OttesenSCG-928-G15]|nr:6-phosphogluconolactonase [Desulfovibrio sp. OttesenSCG-928-G15]
MTITTHLSLYVTEDEQAMAEQAAAIIAEEHKEAVTRRGVFSIALSGGKTPIPLFKTLCQPQWKEAIDWSKTVIYWVDERCVPPDDEHSHYQRARVDLLSRVDATRFYRMKGEDNPKAAAEAYSTMLADHFSVLPGDFPRFDLVLLGVGTDGHTGCLYSGDPALRETESFVMDVHHPEQRVSRLTMTLPVLNNSRCCIFMASGSAKNHILSSALNLMAAPVLPAQMVRPHNGKLCWIIDNNAYQG